MTFDGSGLEDDNLWSYAIKIGPDYFKSMNIPLLKGRYTDYDDHFLTEYVEDHAGPLPIIINESFANTFFKGLDPINQIFYKGSHDRAVQVVGVVKDFSIEPGEDPSPAFFIPYHRYSVLTDFLVMHVSSDLPSDALLPIVKERVEAFNSSVPIGYLSTIEERMDEAFSEIRMGSFVVGSLALIGLLLCALGTWALFRFELDSRQRELSVRMAIGATRPRILMMVASAIGVQVIIGYAIGVSLFAFSWEKLRAYFYQVDSFSPGIFSLVLGVLLIIAGISVAGSMLRISRWQIADLLRS